MNLNVVQTLFNPTKNIPVNAETSRKYISVFYEYEHFDYKKSFESNK